MRAALLPLAIVMSPQVVLSALALGLPVLAPLVVADAGMAPESVGLISGCAGFGAVWMFAANGAVTPVLGPLRALMAACLLAVLGTLIVLTGWAPAIFLGAVIMGFAYGMAGPAGSQILSTHAPKNLWGTLFSIRQAGVPLGGAIAGLVGTGLAALYGWRIGFLALTVPPILCAALLVFVPVGYRSMVGSTRLRLRALFEPRLVAAPFRTLKAMPQLQSVTLASLGFAMVQGSLFAFFTTYLTDGLGIAIVLAGSLYATMQIASFAGRLSIGVLADWLGEIRPLLRALSLGGAAACILMACLDESWPEPILFAIAIVVGIASATWNGLFLAEVARLATDQDVSRATAGATFFTFVAYMVTPALFAGIVALTDYQTAFALCALAPLANVMILRAEPRGTLHHS